MGFLRENIFFVVIGAAVVVLGGLLVVWNLQASGAVDELIVKRTQLADDLARLGRGKPVNNAVFKEKHRQVEQVRAAAREIFDRTRDWNRRDFEVIQLQYQDDRGDTRQIPAFPIDREKYRGFVLTFKLVQTYRSQLESLLAGMNATTVPSTEQIQQEQHRWKERLDFELSREKEKQDKADNLEVKTPTSPTSPSTGMGRLMPPEMGGMPPDMGTRRDASRRSTRRSRTVGRDVSNDAQEKGHWTAVMQKARAGEIYADMDSFNPVLLGNEITATDSKLWQAQVHLWVTGEIVRAIQQTNQQVLESYPQEERNVMTAPIKQLVSLSVNSDYYTGGLANFASSSGRKTRPSSRERQRGSVPDPRLMPTPSGGPMGPSMGQMPGASSSRRKSSDRSSKKTEPQAGTVTGRACCQTYDVVHYSFTVVMPTRYLTLLQENLLRRNNHTILNLGINPVSDVISQELCYYGTDPVVQVTLDSELLLLTSWERGTWDSEARQWSQQFPPLMPTEVLETISAVAPEAMRNEDQERLPRKKKTKSKKR